MIIKTMIAHDDDDDDDHDDDDDGDDDLHYNDEKKNCLRMNEVRLGAIVGVPQLAGGGNEIMMVELPQ